MAYPIKKKRSFQKSKTRLFGKWIIALFSIVLIAIIAFSIYKFRDGFLYYLGFKSNKYANELSVEERKLAGIRIFEVLQKQLNFYLNDQYSFAQKNQFRLCYEP